MRSLAIENCAKLMAKAYEQGDTQALEQYITKFRILTDRKSQDASVIKELVNQEVK